MTLNRTQLKYIAVTAMLIDHIGMLFIPITTPLGALCRIIGRLTAPIMCMFIAEGYRHTRSKIKYALRLLLFAVVSQPFYALVHNNSIYEPDFNMIFTLFLSFLALCCVNNIKHRLLAFLCTVTVVCLSTYGDWGITAPLWVLCFYKFSDNRKKLTAAFLLVCLFWFAKSALNSVSLGYPWYAEYCQLGLILFLPMMYSYNGEKGSDSKFSKWFFYIFYPLHLLLLFVVDKLV